jgi:hypothetical protein
MSLRREPTAIIGTVAAILAVLVPFGVEGFSAEQVGLINTAMLAVLGAVNAITVRPIAPAVFTYAVSALATLAAAYGFELPAGAVGAIGAAVVAVLALVTRAQVTPAASERGTIR